MQVRPIVVNKGCANRVHIGVRNSDRKPVNMGSKSIFAWVTDNQTEQTVIYKLLDTIDESRGEFELFLSDADLHDLRPGFYRFALTEQDLDGTEEFLFSDQGYNVVQAFEVKDYAKSNLKEAVEMDPSEFLYKSVMDESGNFVTRFFSPALKADAYYGFQDNLHTMAVYLTSFTGRVFMQGTLEATAPTDDNEWFLIQIDPIKGFVEYRDFTGVDPFNFTAAVQYVRFVIEPAATFIQTSTPVGIAFGGTGYQVGDFVTLSGGTVTEPAVLAVQSVGVLGDILTATVYDPGLYVVPPANPISQASTTGIGLGATFSLTFQSNAGTVDKILFRN